MFKRFLASVILILCLCTVNVNAYTKPISPISKIYNEGIYRFNNDSDVIIDITLETDTDVKMIGLDEDLNISFISRLPYKEKFTLRTVRPNSTICIIGDGDVDITFTKK